ncbi:uncharacterized protein At3g60930, chloroplastic-like [Eutrema salsugineum]|uniref:uncharacterized protein At3g60930, chloroplastic-like n=1 Tax=Eutrema salsugineum TaxID=72664 RepID=UPI000CED053D|nr:uncharacterized protein At3g60930, chloroplastic-like [Eutrema salsugineum]
MPSRSDDSLDSLFHYEPSRVDVEARGTTESSEASVSPTPSNRSPTPGIPFLMKILITPHSKPRRRHFPLPYSRQNRQKPDPPGSTLFSLESFEALRHRFGISEAVEFVVPEKSDRADKPLENHFTLYEAFLKLCFLWFPIPGVILEYLWKHGISIGQILPRGLRHMIVRSFLPPIPDDLFTVRDSLSARKVNWRKNFTLERVEKARAILARVPVSSSSSSSSRDTREKMVIITLRDRKRREEEEAARRAAEAAQTQTKAVPQSDQPSREEGETVRAVDAIVTEAGEGGAAPELEPGEIIPEASKDDSAARSKTSSNSAILALPKSSRPPTSVVQKHDPSRKRSAADKGKGVAVRKDEPSMKKRKSTPGDPAGRKLVVDDPDASAVMFVRVNNANTRLPPPEKLRRPSLAAINELMAEYEADLSKVERRFDEARNKEARRAKSAEVALLKRRIEAKDALFEAKVKRAKKEARRELTAKFQERLAKVEEGLAKLEKAKTDENELGQIKGNLAMIAVLKKPDATTLDDEEAQLKSWESEYADDDAYERIASEIRGELVFSPVSPDSVDTSFGNEPLEETAAKLGVADPNKSNAGTPALSNLLAECETQSAA